MATKTYAFGLNTIPMADWDTAIATYFGYDPVINTAETKAQYGRRYMAQLAQSIFTAGSVRPAVDTAEITTINSLGAIS